MGLQDITAYANELEAFASLLVNDDDVTKLLHYDDKDPIHKASLTINEKMDLMGTRIIKRDNVKVIENTAGSFLTLKIGELTPAQNNPSVIIKRFVVSIVCHNGTIETNYGERDLLLLKAIMNIFDKENTVGQGRTYLAMARSLVFNSNDFNGYTISVIVTDSPN